MSSSNKPTVRVIKKTADNLTLGSEPKYDLKRTGDDPTDHEGIEWIYLHCPHCSTYAKFTVTHTVIVAQPPDKLDMLVRDFYSFAECDYCNDVVYIKAWEVDWDPDWHFSYQYHHPTSTHKVSEYELPPSVLASLLEAYKCMQAGAYIATVVMCRRTIEFLLIDKGVNKKIGLAKALEKVAKDLTLHDSMVRVANLVRIVGNVGAHGNEEQRIDKGYAEEVYSLTEKLLEMIYVLPAKADEIKSKLETEKSTSPSI